MTGPYQEGEHGFGTYIEWKRPFFRVVVLGTPDEIYREGWVRQVGELRLPIRMATSSAAKVRQPE